ncbi:dethiobiotin synthase [Verrucomicrobia bacterium LW23]|nr:dethiobiotin synthase [Verrucomicrobia bacterium LW23]
MMHIFVTGTDTDVGKTYFGAWLLRQWLAAEKGDAAAGHSLAFKPICSGGRGDAEAYAAVPGHGLLLDEINPLHFREPLSPLAAAAVEGREDGMDFADIVRLNAHVVRVAAKRQAQRVLVEGVGGWLVPLGKNPTLLVRDWAQSLGWPVVVVARAGLGTLNHTLLTVESIQAAGLTCAGVVLNEGAPAAVGAPSVSTPAPQSPATAPEGPSAPGVQRSALASATGVQRPALPSGVNGAILVALTGLPVFTFPAGAEGVGLLPVWLSGKQA